MSQASGYVPSHVLNGGRSNQAKHGNFCRAPKAHGRFAAYANAKLTRSGHFWQNRFFSCPLDETHLWAALRYVEQNPLRAQMVARANLFRWSSAAAHTGLIASPAWLAPEPMQSTFTPEEWEVCL